MYDNIKFKRNIGLVTSPYGNLPQLIIGADKKLYLLENVYYFDDTGASVKLEWVSRNDRQLLEKELLNFGADTDAVPQVDFVPQEEDSRYVKLSGEDYEKVDFILKSIEDGNFRKPQDLDFKE